jgi:beta-glucosidase-like glycosyl hydrolase
MTLDKEVGAVMMVGFRGPLTDAVLADWQSHQFGGLLIVDLNQNASTDDGLASTISRLRGVSRRRLLAATDQEGGGVCLAASSVPCAPMPVGQAVTTQMATALHHLGFDQDLGPVSDVCSGPPSIMWGRCYGTDPAAVTALPSATTDGAQYSAVK